MSKTGSTTEEPLEELVRNPDGTIPDPVGFEPSEEVKIKTRYVEKMTSPLTFPLDHIYCLHESDWCVEMNPDLGVRELAVRSYETWEEHRFRVTIPDEVTDEFYDRLETYEKVSPEHFNIERVSDGVK